MNKKALKIFIRILALPLILLFSSIVLLCAAMLAIVGWAYEDPEPFETFKITWEEFKEYLRNILK